MLRCQFDNAFLLDEKHTARQHYERIVALQGDGGECPIQLGGAP